MILVFFGACVGWVDGLGELGGWQFNVFYCFHHGVHRGAASVDAKSD